RIVVFLDVQFRDRDEQAKASDVLQEWRIDNGPDWPLRQVEMRLQSDAVERSASSLQPLEQLQEMVAPVAFDLAVGLERKLVDHQFGARGETTGLVKGTHNVVGPERLQEHAAAQSIHAILGLDRLV